MSVTSANELVQQLRASRLLSQEQLTSVSRDLAPLLPDPRHLLRDLVQRGWLKPEQANLLIQGRGQELAPPAPKAPEPELIDSGLRWKLALILAGVFLVIFIIALATNRGGKEKKDPFDFEASGKDDGGGKTPEWPDDLAPIEGVTQSSRSGTDFLGKNTKGRDVVTVEGKLILRELSVERIIVHQGSTRREYHSIEAVPRPHLGIAETLHELGQRELFGTWSR